MNHDVSRRDFLGSLGVTTAMGAVYSSRSEAQEPKPKSQPQASDANAKVAAASESVVLGFVGVGGMGTGLLNIFKNFPDVRIAAVCDVHEPHALRAKSEAGGGPEVYKDFRQVLDRKDLDAVVVATPDHWHFLPSTLACLAEKDVYCEKPLSHSIAEGRLMVKAAAKTKRVTQMGNLIHAGENYHRMVEIVQSGVLGQITKCRVWMAANRDAPGGLGKPADTAPPAGCDYDFWLGPAPRRPFNPNRFTFNWRFFWDYGGGMLTDFCCHLIDPIHWAMKVKGPVAVSATGGRYALKDNGETPDNLEVTYHFAEGFDLVWSHSDSSSHGFWKRGAGIAFQGTHGTMIGHYNDHEIFWENGKETALPEKTLPRSPGHHREWINAIKSRATTSCNFAYGHQVTSYGNIGNIALKVGETIRWDPEQQRVTSHPDANKYLQREVYRAPWTLPRVD